VEETNHCAFGVFKGSSQLLCFTMCFSLYIFNRSAHKEEREL